MRWRRAARAGNSKRAPAKSPSASPPRVTGLAPASRAQEYPWSVPRGAALRARANRKPEHLAPCSVPPCGDAPLRSKTGRIAVVRGSMTLQSRADSTRTQRRQASGRAPRTLTAAAIECHPEYQYWCHPSHCYGFDSLPRPPIWATCRSCHIQRAQTPARTPFFSADSPGCISKCVQSPPPT